MKSLGNYTHKFYQNLSNLHFAYLCTMKYYIQFLFLLYFVCYRSRRSMLSKKIEVEKRSTVATYKLWVLLCRGDLAKRFGNNFGVGGSLGIN